MPVCRDAVSWHISLKTIILITEQLEPLFYLTNHDKTFLRMNDSLRAFLNQNQPALLPGRIYSWPLTRFNNFCEVPRINEVAYCKVYEARMRDEKVKWINHWRSRFRSN